MLLLWRRGSRRRDRRPAPEARIRRAGGTRARSRAARRGAAHRSARGNAASRPAPAPRRLARRGPSAVRGGPGSGEASAEDPGDSDAAGCFRGPRWVEELLYGGGPGNSEDAPGTLYPDGRGDLRRRGRQYTGPRDRGLLLDGGRLLGRGVV